MLELDFQVFFFSLDFEVYFPLFCDILICTFGIYSFPNNIRDQDAIMQDSGSQKEGRGGYAINPLSLWLLHGVQQTQALALVCVQVLL